MLKPTDLRIGNLLTYENEQKPILSIDAEREFTNKKTGETLKCAIMIGQYLDDGSLWTTNGRWLNYFEPIKLTDEWLYGFGGEVYFDCYILDRFKFFWKDDYKYWYVVDKETSTYLTKIEFVHELQNFYFIMNGKEVELREGTSN